MNSQPQKAWYHETLAKICLAEGDERTARDHAEKVVRILENMGRPDCMARFFLPYLLIGDLTTANDMAYRSLTLMKATVDIPADELAVTYAVYHILGHDQAFYELYKQIETNYAVELKNSGILQFGVRLGEHLTSFPTLELEENFNWINNGSMLNDWEWIDPEGSSSYAFQHELNRLDISAACRARLTLLCRNAPRLSRRVSGDFALETKIGLEKCGGLFVTGDEHIIILEHGTRHEWFGEIGGVGFVDSDTVVARSVIDDAEYIMLRLERSGNSFLTYYSYDGQNWCNCGWTESNMEDPVQVGIFASGPWEGSQNVTSFDYFRIFRE